VFLCVGTLPCEPPAQAEEKNDCRFICTPVLSAFPSVVLQNLFVQPRVRSLITGLERDLDATARGIRRATNVFTPYSYDQGVDLREQLNVVDIGDVFTIPGNLEKSFDQISRAMDHVVKAGAFPVVLGGDHSIGYPTIRGLAPHMSGNVGIIHFDRHVDTQEYDLDERMHTTPFFHATNIPNAPAVNLVQIGIGGWQAPRPGVKVGRKRGTTIITVGDVAHVGIEKIAEMALEIAWKGAKAVYLSFDIDVIDSCFSPGTGWPEPDGLLPREALGLVRLISQPGLAGMEIVECSPPYDWAEQTSLVSARGPRLSGFVDPLGQARQAAVGDKAGGVGSLSK
jgi:agmatinase